MSDPDAVQFFILEACSWMFVFVIFTDSCFVRLLWSTLSSHQPFGIDPKKLILFIRTLCPDEQQCSHSQVTLSEKNLLEWIDLNHFWTDK